MSNQQTDSKMTADEAVKELESINIQNARLKEFYDSQLDLMRTQLQFENMKSDIKEAQFRGKLAEAKMAQLVAIPPQVENGEKTPGEITKNPNMKIKKDE